MTRSDLSLKVELYPYPLSLQLVCRLALVTPLGTPASWTRLAAFPGISGITAQVTREQRFAVSLCSNGRPVQNCNVNLLSQIDAIFRHQSQKDRTLFPGADPREFWQRARDRNEVCTPRFHHSDTPHCHSMHAVSETFMCT